MNFTFLFYKHIMFRHSCGKCHFCNTIRPSDITIADFWGWEKSVPGMNKDDKGVSLILVNTPKGRKIFEAVKEKLNTTQVEIEDCLQPNLQYPSTIHPERVKFQRDYQKHGFMYVYFKYGEEGWRHKVKKLKQRVKNKIKWLINR